MYRAHERQSQPPRWMTITRFQEQAHHNHTGESRPSTCASMSQASKACREWSCVARKPFAGCLQQVCSSSFCLRMQLLFPVGVEVSRSCIRGGGSMVLCRRQSPPWQAKSQLPSERRQVPFLCLRMSQNEVLPHILLKTGSARRQPSAQHHPLHQLWLWDTAERCRRNKRQHCRPCATKARMSDVLAQSAC